MYLGLGLRLGSSTVTGFDADAVAYFNRASVTDATAKGQINAFVKGMKDLGLYNSMVCYPLRSAQNSPSGTTIYSLGGLGTFNGTLVNSPTRASDFMVFSDITKSMDISGLTGLTTTMFLMTVARYGYTFNGTLGIDINSTALFGGQPTNYMHTVTDATGVISSGMRTDMSAGFSAWANLATSVADDDIGTLFIGYNGTNQLFRWNNTTQSRVIGTTVGIGTIAKLNIRSDGFGSGGQGGLSDYAFTMMCNGGVSDANFQSIRTLYKTTLGTGLGLP
jgi:hypothetical protein